MIWVEVAALIVAIAAAVFAAVQAGEARRARTEARAARAEAAESEAAAATAAAAARADAIAAARERNAIERRQADALEATAAIQARANRETVEWTQLRGRGSQFRVENTGRATATDARLVPINARGIFDPLDKGPRSVAPGEALGFIAQGTAGGDPEYAIEWTNPDGTEGRTTHTAS